MNKLILLLSLITILSCSLKNGETRNTQLTSDNSAFVTHPNYEGTKSSDPLNKYLKGFNTNPAKPDGKTGCILMTMDVWKFNKYGSDGWSRHQSWIDLGNTMINEPDIGIDDGKEDSSAYLAKRRAENPKSDYWSQFIYIGPWKYVPKIGKEIRFVATQHHIYGGIRTFFESKTEENAKIPEMPEIKLARSPEMNLDYCKVLWMKTYGYNAIAENYRQVRPGFWNWLFRNKELVITGKIIDAKE